MALPNRGLTAAEITAMTKTPAFAFSASTFMGLLRPDVRYSKIDYEAARNKASFTTSDQFFIRRRSSPSDCVWIIPGTVQWR